MRQDFAAWPEAVSIRPAGPQFRSHPVAAGGQARVMNVWRILVRYAGWRLGLSALCGLAGGAALAALMGLAHRTLTLAAPDLPVAAAQFAVLLAVYFLGTFFAEHAVSDAAERLQLQLRRSLLRQLLRLPLRRIEQLGHARLYAVVSEYVGSIAQYLCYLPDAVIDLALALGCLAYMAWLSPAVFGFNLIFIAVAAACYVLPERRAQRTGRSAAAAWEQHTGQMHYAVQAARLLLLSPARREDFIAGHFNPAGDRVRELNRGYRLMHLFAERFAEALVLANVGCLLFVLPRFIALTPATATGLLLAAVFVRAPLKSLLKVFSRTRTVRVQIGRIAEAGLDLFAPPAEPEAPVPAEPFRELALEQVAFGFESDHGQKGFGVGPLSLRLRAGEVVFLVGGNGAGKTTLAKLMCGLYAPASGHVRLNGAAVSDEAGRTRLRAQFAAVFTEDPLFGHVLGVPPAQAERAGNALLAELRLEHKVRLEGTGFSTTDLSQGQRRRLLLVAALLEDRPVLLLDEWTADQDPQFRAFFYEQLLPELRARGKTLVLITHDDRYFDRADRVIKLESGRLGGD